MTTQPKPSIAERAAEKICPECGGKVERRSARGRMPTFCSDACKRDHNNRHTVEGRAIIALLKAWRIDRGSGEIAKAAFAQAVTIIDQFNADDRDAARPRADLYAAKLMADQRLYMDRRNEQARKLRRARKEG
jgi:endogenous inhibitor of DNA gyrase (YacG/DUF329 family)